MNAYVLSGSERKAYELTRLFIGKRLTDSAILIWATKLNAQNEPAREAVRDAIDVCRIDLPASWHTAWQLVVESWEAGIQPNTHSGEEYDLHRRIAAGDRSGELINKIVLLVRPTLKLEVREKGDRRGSMARDPADVLSASITSVHPIDPVVLGVQDIHEASFLSELANELDASLNRTLALLRRLGIAGQEWRIGLPNRVYWVAEHMRGSDEHEPDEFSHGIATITKLLYAVVARLCEVDADLTSYFMTRWLRSSEKIYARLWSAMARVQETGPAQDVARFLTTCNDDLFWSLDSAPEVAEMRALRFSSLSKEEQMAVCARVRKGPSINYLKEHYSPPYRRSARIRRIMQELERIELAGGVLSKRLSRWLESQRGKDDKALVTSVTGGFRSLSKARFVAPNPNPIFSEMRGEERLRALEAALGSRRASWNEDPAGRASDWLGTGKNIAEIISDLSTLLPTPLDFPLIWERLGWLHRPKRGEDGQLTTESFAEGGQIAELLIRAPTDALAAAIEGLTSWLDSWARDLPRNILHKLWHKLWPMAVVATNAQTRPDEDPLNSVVQGDPSADPGDLDVLNSAAGRLVGVFLSVCPSVGAEENLFSQDRDLVEMRDYIAVAPGRSGLIGLYRMTQALGYFLRASYEWTQQNLVAPLEGGSWNALILWRAVASQQLYANELKQIGGRALARVLDNRLGRKSRGSLAISIILDTLHSFDQGRSPSIQISAVTQMLRSVEDEIRVEVAQIVQRFVRDMSSIDNVERRRTPEHLFDHAVVPFIEAVWPQDAGLVSPAVSRAFADVPAACGERFCQAVEILAPRLVPFESWSLFDYGLRGAGESRIGARIDSSAKAEALLVLLDATISGADGVAVPMELADALEHIAVLAPTAASRPPFRRLSAIARR